MRHARGTGGLHKPTKNLDLGQLVQWAQRFLPFWRIRHHPHQI